MAQGDQLIDLLFQSLELVFRHGVILKQLAVAFTIVALASEVNDTRFSVISGLPGPSVPALAGVGAGS
jgi:hypothetical protein